MRSWLEKRGIQLEPDGEDYKADIKAKVEEHHEVEVKSNWNGDWPGWRTVHIPVRKKKLLGQSDRLIFWVLNNDCSQAILINGIHLKDKYIKNISKKRAPNGEDFYDIPISHCNFITL